ncbi:unnamed protein product [Adineta steineri]|uniref:Uncharacterized protein n=1 Tax=Adineta steineri TaxID=433720 RepID=A0A815ES76_9BILA|nr:unnamed protein product [Adineta steineri]
MLNLMSTKIGCQGAQYLADGLKNNTTLIKLEIGQNPIEVQQQRYLTNGETAESSPLDSSRFRWIQADSSDSVCTTTTTLVASCHSYEVSWNNHCYYLDGSGGNCTSGYSQATNAVLTCIATQFAAGPSLVGCTNAQQHYSQQLTFCGSN